MLPWRPNEEDGKSLEAHVPLSLGRKSRRWDLSDSWEHFTQQWWGGLHCLRDCPIPTFSQAAGTLNGAKGVVGESGQG